ncbi:MAG TPA: transcriptional regulator NrdR [Candidatus Norongarragalinales archaeon]|nr:transcriptional regulator NrdR [Candidatus Norongarragalinales archaeon]
MKCPFCGHSETKVLDSRDAEDLELTRRRRECEHCAKRFTTYERVEFGDFYVVKNDGRKEKFLRDKVLHGVKKACAKRPVTQEQVEDVVDKVEWELRHRGESEVPSSKIGELVLKKLKKLDEVAYIRFASVYRSFTDLESFVGEVKALQKD